MSSPSSHVLFCLVLCLFLTIAAEISHAQLIYSSTNRSVGGSGSATIFSSDSGSFDNALSTVGADGSMSVSQSSFIGSDAITGSFASEASSTTEQGERASPNSLTAIFSVNSDTSFEFKGNAVFELNENDAGGQFSGDDVISLTGTGISDTVSFPYFGSPGVGSATTDFYFSGTFLSVQTYRLTMGSGIIAISNSSGSLLGGTRDLNFSLDVGATPEPGTLSLLAGLAISTLCFIFHQRYRKSVVAGNILSERK